MIQKPMLAAKNPVMQDLKFPVGATPKIDGIRCLKTRGQALSRAFKPIPNKYVRETIEASLPDGLDGELIAPGEFNDVQSQIMTHAGEPPFKYLIFDYVKDSIQRSYEDRIEDLLEIEWELPSFCEVLKPVVCHNLEELQSIIDRHLQEGYEGTMIRSLTSPYKFGRSTLKEGYLIALKHFVDDEAVVIGFTEQHTNTNEQTKDELGYAERSSKKDGMVPNGHLGTFKVRHKDGREFEVGSGRGLTKALRKEIWENQSKYLGKLITFRYQPHGVKELPRIPVWHGFRHKDDTSEG